MDFKEASSKRNLLMLWMLQSETTAKRKSSAQMLSRVVNYSLCSPSLCSAPLVSPGLASCGGGAEYQRRLYFSYKSQDICEGVQCSKLSSGIIFHFMWDYHCITLTLVSFGIGLPLPPTLAPEQMLDQPAFILRLRPFLTRSSKILPGSQSWLMHHVLQIFPAHLLVASASVVERHGSKWPSFWWWWAPMGFSPGTVPARWTLLDCEV